MQHEYRLYTYAFLSRVMSGEPDQRFVHDLRHNRDLLETIGEETLQWFDEHDDEALLDALNADYSSMFIINTQPIESFILDAKNETLVGLQNPAMAFYFQNGFEVDMTQTNIMAPDHLSIELAFMQTLVYRGEQTPQLEFMQEHLIPWVIPYMAGMRSMADTPFYHDMCNFIIEFLVADYDFLMQERSRGA
ncbi:MAG: molecular chaperone TorD family protein [Campylobacterales bacterium]|nr:molecular chaperone TorD family protein [Campylobacterales bacterium]